MNIAGFTVEWRFAVMYFDERHRSDTLVPPYAPPLDPTYMESNGNGGVECTNLRLVTIQSQGLSVVTTLPNSSDLKFPMIYTFLHSYLCTSRISVLFNFTYHTAYK